MEKMIGIINDNLKTVISGIKTHREETEKKLVTIKNEMDDKIAIASDYKEKVEEARNIITALENEISELENDLEELNSKFGAKDFKEILTAGNREINTKIIEKRALISEQSENIKELTDKAHILKEGLVKLREIKNNLEATLRKTLVLESYYEKRIMSIVEYSLENPHKLDEYVEEEPQEELMVSDLDLDNIDFTQTIDGKVFEEIDEISTTSEVDEDFIKEVLVEDIELDEIEEEKVEDEKEEVIDLSMTQQLDKIILEANNLLERSEEIKEKTESHMLPEDKGILDLEEQMASLDSEAHQGNSLEIFVDDDLEDTNISDSLIVTPTIEDNVFDNISHIDSTNIPEYLENIKDDEESVQEQEVVLESEEQQENELFDDDSTGVIDLVIENDEDEDEEIEEDDNVFDFASFSSDDDEFYQELLACELDDTRFNNDDLVKLRHNFNKENTNYFLEVMDKHKIPKDTIYYAADVLINVTPQNLDHMLTLLKSTKATTSDIKHVFSSLDTVNINKLEEVIDANKEAELSELIYEAGTYKGESNLIERLNLNEKEESELRRNTPVDEFKMMNMFTDVVVANYNTLKSLNVKNLKDCITKHPHRFIMNPSGFQAILDKYDTDDLIRCINKNAAVLDKL